MYRIHYLDIAVMEVDIVIDDNKGPLPVLGEHVLPVSMANQGNRILPEVNFLLKSR